MLVQIDDTNLGTFCRWYCINNMLYLLVISNITCVAYAIHRVAEEIRSNFQDAN